MSSVKTLPHQIINLENAVIRGLGRRRRKRRQAGRGLDSVGRMPGLRVRGVPFAGGSRRRTSATALDRNLAAVHRSVTNPVQGLLAIR